MLNFSQAVIEKLGFYVYVLKDPRNQSVFYVGKGKENRIFSHTATDFKESNKNLLIKEIEKEGLSVIREIVHFGLSENEALSAETTLINYIGLPQLANKVKGHSASIHQRYTVEEFEAIYGAQPVKVTHKVMVFKVNNIWYKEISNEELYNKTRGYWRINEKKYHTSEYAFAVYKGLVKAVYKPISWHKIKFLNESHPYAPNQEQLGESRNLYRSYFVGVQAEPEVQELYLNKDISQYTNSSQNPIIYINSNNQ